MPAKIRLLVIDPQVDFCEGGALPVSGGNGDMERLAAMVDRLGHRLADIDVSLDSHRVVDVAHPAWWVDSQGRNPAPFTMISAADVAAGTWAASNPAWRKRSLEYVQQLEARGKYVLLIWPEHCLIGSSGHAVHPALFGALERWEKQKLAMVNYVMKGTNPFTEAYSALQAEIPDPEDPTTLLNAELIDALRDSDIILIAGEALSHCVKATVEDLADNIGEEHIKKFVLLSDCSSAIPASPGGPDFPAIAADFVERMKARGMQTARSNEFLAS